MTVTQNEQLIINLGKGTRIFEKDHVKKALEAYEIKTGCANYERDNVLMSEMEQNVADYYKTNLPIQKSSYYTYNDTSVDNGIKLNREGEAVKEEVKIDSIVESIREKFLQRSLVGQAKYKVTLDREDLSIEDWLEHAIQEGMDKLLYLSKVKKDLNELVRNTHNDQELGRKLRSYYK